MTTVITTEIGGAVADLEAAEAFLDDEDRQRARGVARSALGQDDDRFVDLQRADRGVDDAEEDDGEIHGRVMRKKRRHGGVPSMIAASMIGRGTPCSAAMKMTMKKPVFFHTSMITIEAMALCAVGQPAHGRQAEMA